MTDQRRDAVLGAALVRLVDLALAHAVFDLLARSQRGLASVTDVGQDFSFPSKSRPGDVNKVRILAGIASCTCTMIACRGNCSHPREAASRVTAHNAA